MKTLEMRENSKNIIGVYLQNYSFLSLDIFFILLFNRQII